MADNLHSLASKMDVLIGLHEVLKSAKKALSENVSSEDVAMAFLTASKELIEKKDSKMGKAYMDAGTSFSDVDLAKITASINELLPQTEKVSKIADNLTSSFGLGNDPELSKTLMSSYKDKHPKSKVTDLLIDFSDLNSSNSGVIVGTLLTSSGKIFSKEFSLKDGKVVKISEVNEKLKAEFKESDMNFCPNCGKKVQSCGNLEMEEEPKEVESEDELPDLECEEEDNATAPEVEAEDDEEDFDFDDSDDILEELEDDEDLDDEE